MKKVAAVLLVVLATNGCASLGPLNAIVQPPRFEQAPDQPAEIRLVGPAPGLPIGGAAVRIWTRVSNPNAFGFTLGTLKGTLFLEEQRAADAEFPLGLPLGAGQQTVIPIDLSISFSDLPGLADVVRRAVSRRSLPYHLDGTIGVDVASLAKGLVFGPMTLVRGTLQPR